MNILFLSHSSTRAGFTVGSHHYAHNLSKMGHKVVHIGSPITPFHLPFSKRADRFEARLGNPKLAQKHWLFDEYLPLIPFPYGTSRMLDRLNNLILHRMVEAAFAGEIDVIIIDQPKLHPFLETCKDTPVIYRPTDVYSTMEKSDIRRQELAALERCSAVIATSRAVEKHINGLGFTVECIINNGVDFDAFQRHAIDGSRNSHCVYVGAIDYRFDLELVLTLARDNPQIRFDIFGPLTLPLPGQRPGNLRFAGNAEYTELPQILSRYRMALMPFNDHPANISRSPMKLFEYLSIGLPVFAKAIPSLEGTSFCGVVETYADGDGACQRFRRFHERIDTALSGRCLDMARQQSWECKTMRLLDVIAGLGAARMAAEPSRVA